MGDSEELYTSSQASVMSGATTTQLKNWDRHGVLRVRRTGEGQSNNRKLYTACEVDRARDILVLQELGLTLGEIQEILDAPEDERSVLLMSYATRMKKSYDRLLQRIQLSSAAGVFGVERLKEAAGVLGDKRRLGDAYSEDENLHQMVRWVKSHTKKDIELFSAELAIAVEGIAALDESVEQVEWEQALVRFCDVWGSRLGWPTLGQMHLFHEALSRDCSYVAEIDRALGKGVSRNAARIFLLGWVSGTLELLDDILICLYLRSDEGITVETVGRFAEVLAAVICEAGGQPYLYNGLMAGRCGKDVALLSEAVFSALVDAVLDDETGRYFDLDGFSAIDGSSLDTMQQLVYAFAEDRLQHWLERRGCTQLNMRRNEWMGVWEEVWRSEEIGGKGLDLWLQERFADLLADSPESRWATEGESCCRERINREFLEEYRIDPR